MPHDVSGDDADRPDNDRQGRNRPHEGQQPEHVPRVYDRSAYKRSCHWPCKCARGPDLGLASQPYRRKKAHENCQCRDKLRSQLSLKRCKHGIIEAKALHKGSERTKRNASVIEKRDVQKSEDTCRKNAVAQTNAPPVEWRKYNRKKFHRDCQRKGHACKSTPASAQRCGG